MNTLKKVDSLEVEVESSCHVKTLGRKERNGGGVKEEEDELSAHFTYGHGQWILLLQFYLLFASSFCSIGVV